MSNLTVRLDKRDRSEIVSEMREAIRGVADELLQEFRTLKVAVLADGRAGEGVQLLSVSEVARMLDRTDRQLRREEDRGEVPPRRRISERRVAYFRHEIEGVPAEVARVRDERKVGYEQLARKLGLGRATIERMARSGELPERCDGRHWYERDIDMWLLERPQVRD